MKLLEIENNKLQKDNLDVILTPEVENLGHLFTKHGFDLRIVGGAVRDLLIGRKPKDIDLATDATPDEMVAFLEKEGLRTIPTGIEHGTITAIGPDTGEPYEITTLRIDVETTGRHASVSFTRDWKLDAERRDLTFNAMSIDMEGNLYDYFGGAQDLRDYVTKFVGDADKRIKEDYLRILRFFRFLGKMDSWKIEPGQIEAIRNNAEGLLQISGERIWMEMAKILTGKHVYNILNAMCDLGVAEQINIPCNNLSTVQRVSEKTDNPITVLSSLMNNQSAAETVAFQWKLSNPEKELLMFLMTDKPLTEWNAKNMLVDGVSFEYIYELAVIQGKGSISTKLKNWPIPIFPVTGKDLIVLGMKPGIEFGNTLKSLRDKWKISQFTLNKTQLLSYLNIKESVQWAMKPEHAYGAGRNDLTDPNYKVMWLNIEDVFQVTAKDQRLDPKHPTGGDNRIGNRIEVAKQHWFDGGYMNLSLIGWNEYSNTFNFTDGRHRLIAAYQIGERWAPILVDKDSVNKVKELIRIKNG